MKSLSQKKLCLVLIILSLSIAIVIIACGFVAKNKIEEPEKWVLRSYANNVALYNGDEIIEVYGSIVLDTLPEDDKRQLDKGIAFPTRSEAQSAIEDYDG